MTITIILILMIVAVEFFAHNSTKFFKGYIMTTKNGRQVPDVLSKYRKDKKQFLKLAKPFLLFSMIEIILIVLLIMSIV